jgi:hypothetical protein
MASFHTKTFTRNDEYMTPKSAWESVKEYIPKDKVIWEGFSGTGSSQKYLTELGFNVISKNEDFFENDHGDIIITNPPFTKKKEVLQRLKELSKPFMLICPCSMINTKYFRELFKDEKIQIIIPRRRIQFEKVNKDGSQSAPNRCNFDCFYYCYKMNLDRDIIWLEN